MPEEPTFAQAVVPSCLGGLIAALADVRRGVQTGGDAFAVGDVVLLHLSDGTQAGENSDAVEGSLGVLQALWQTSAGAAMRGDTEHCTEVEAMRQMRQCVQEHRSRAVQRSTHVR